MGTNYYVAENYCECCKQYREELHIGKSSYGWSFTFQGYDRGSYSTTDGQELRLTSWKAWKEYLKDKIIVNEYGEKVEYGWFVHYIETVKNPGAEYSKMHHNDEGRKEGWFDSHYDWDDEDGYSFGTREFS